MNRVQADPPPAPRSMSRNGRAAQAYALRFGWPVFPVAPRDKRPIPSLAPRGYLDATTDPDTIAAWWGRAPEANVGVACDERSGLLALDIDPRNGGLGSLGALLLEHGPLPLTVQAATGGGGRHIIFRRPEGLKFRGTLCAGVDVKASGYILVAPSMHPSGTPYTWIAGCRPDELEPAELPRWVLERTWKIDIPGARGATTGPAASSFLSLAFAAAGYAVARIDDERVSVPCPWRHEHTADSPASATVIFAPKPETPQGTFHCLHSHCARRTFSDVLTALGPDARADADEREYLRREREAIRWESGL